MTVTLGINGFGRIGRTTLASIFEYGRNDVIVSKVNAPGSIETNAHLLRYDSVHGRFAGKVDVNQNSFDLGRGPIEVLSSYNADDLDWSGCDVVLECTGKFTSYDKAIAHVKNGAKSVLISAPAKNVDRTVIFGVNDHKISRNDRILSNGSCTTNCLAPIAKVLNETVGIEYTNFQITRFNDYSTYLANKPAYDFYNKAAKWYEDNKHKDSAAKWTKNETETALKNIYKSLAMKKKLVRIKLYF